MVGVPIRAVRVEGDDNLRADALDDLADFLFDLEQIGVGERTSVPRPAGALHAARVAVADRHDLAHAQDVGGRPQFPLAQAGELLGAADPDVGVGDLARVAVRDADKRDAHAEGRVVRQNAAGKDFVVGVGVDG